MELQTINLTDSIYSTQLTEPISSFTKITVTDNQDPQTSQPKLYSTTGSDPEFETTTYAWSVSASSLGYTPASTPALRVVAIENEI